MILLVLEGLWDDLSMDFVLDIRPDSNGIDSIVVVVDKFSTVAQFM